MTDWQTITKEEYDLVFAERHESLAVSATFTDLDGLHGDPRIFTEWCDRDTGQLVLRHQRWPQPSGIRPDVRPCEHWIATGDTET